MEKIQTLGQKRSEFALKKVMENEKLKALKSFSAGAPSMILQNGFGQALAFWAAKGKEEHNTLFTIVREWINENHTDFKTETQKEFLMKISQSSQEEYFAVQQETLYLLEWVKRYANAFITD